jgi:hypothetical protein
MAALECAAFGRIFAPMLEINPLVLMLKDIEARTDVLRGYL